MKIPNILATWREEVGRRLLKLDFRSEGDHPFFFQMRPIVMSDQMRVVANRHGPGFTFRDKVLVKDADDSLAIVYPLQGRLRCSQGSDVMLNAKDTVILDASVPGELGAGSACNYMSLIFPRSSLPENIDLSRTRNRNLGRGSPASRLLRSYVDTLAGSDIPPFSDLADTTHRHVLDLVRLVSIECSEKDPRDLLISGTIGEARVRIAQGEIERSFRDPLLCESQIAHRQGITVRHLQRLFEQSGLRFTECVSELRLAAAYRALTDPTLAGRSVMQIAFDVGFSDVSHFNRVFKRRYGATPTDVRHGHDKS